VINALLVFAPCTFLPSSTAMTQLERQPRSGLATVKRDFSSNKTMELSPASVPNTATTIKRSTLSDSLRKAIQDGVASREAEKAALSSSSLDISSQKRSLPFDPDPPSKKRQLPSSWTEPESSTQMKPHAFSHSSMYPKSRSFMISSLPIDLSTGDPSEQKPVRRPPEISLSHEQKQILELVMEQKSIFYTGSAGMLSLCYTYPLPML
jgi:ATP-dependent DNA helicase PIF1